MFSGHTLFIGNQKIHLKSVPSTNVYAQELVSKSKPPEGTVVLADNQTQGRGQMGSKWISTPDKNATFSLILYPKFLKPSASFTLNKVISLGVADALKNLGIKGVCIKWPNDIYVGKLKTGGILIQTTVNTSSIQSAVCGIGLNVNQTEFLTSLPNPASLSSVTGKTWDLELVLEEVFKQIEFRYLQVKGDKEDLLNADYLSSLLGFQTDQKFKDPSGRDFRGKVVGVSPSGKLLLEKVEGVVEYDMKEISWNLE
jgi:BirA family biotin operon repressor/biotin-[acetyl-CoA-carboxylase] ligase